MNILKLTYEYQDYPYHEDTTDSQMNWGWITLLIYSKDVLVRQVFRTQWNITPLINWLLANEEAIKIEDKPAELQDLSATSIAEAFYLFSQSDAEYDDELYDNIYKYRSTHGLRFGMRGADLNAIYLGMNGTYHEISQYNENEIWACEIDINKFFEDVRILRDTVTTS